MSFNWYKKAQSFGTSPFSGSYLSDKSKTSPFGFAGGDEKTGVFEPSSGEHHPNDYMSEDKKIKSTEGRIEEFRKLKNKKNKKRKTLQLKDLLGKPRKEIIATVDRLCRFYKNNGDIDKSKSLKNLISFMPILINDVDKSLKMEKISQKNKNDYNDFLKILVSEINKESQWGTNGPKMPTWDNSDWVFDTYKNITEHNNKTDQSKNINLYLQATATIHAKTNTSQEIGSGFFVGPNKMITCSHVVFPNGEDAHEIIVKFKSKEYKASILSNDKQLDVAVISINDSSFSTKDILEIGDSDKIQQGDNICIIGTPLGFENVISDGIISSLPIDYEESGLQKKYILISANINPGNSGGPVIRKSDNAVIGIVAAVINLENNNGLNAAIPINDVKAFL